MKAVLRGALAALLSFLLAAGSAGACCTDLWSCAGAVASAGLTCAEEAAALALRDLARRLTAERDARKQAFEAAVAAETGQANDVSSAWRRSAEDAAADAARSAKRAAEITGNDTRLRLLASSGVSAPSARPTPTPAASRFGALDTTMKARPIGADPTLEELQKRVESEKREVEARRQRAAEQDATARRAIEEAKVWQVAAFTGGVLAGFASLLTQIAILLGSNDKLKQFVLAANVAGLVVEFVKLEKGFEKDLADAAREAARRRAEAADRPRPDALAAEQHAKRARDLVAAMERISRIQSLEQRPQTARELVLAPTGGPAERAP
ncbi:MAG TPA: hypothetical protein PLB01_16545, partial [Thermoanaerobaculia bacterium]|nr:hypothetical protein [Thermoanaerobaculia bacterium]